MPASIVPQTPFVNYNLHSTYLDDNHVCSDCSLSTATEDENIAASTSHKPPLYCCHCCSMAKPPSPSYTSCQISSNSTFDSAWLVAGKDVYGIPRKCQPLEESNKLCSNSFWELCFKRVAGAFNMLESCFLD